MIQFQNIQCNDSQNKPLLSFISCAGKDAPIQFDDNTAYFIIGESGVGKSTLLSFFTSPFSENPIKNGEIIYNLPSSSRNYSQNSQTISVTNSMGTQAGKHFAYLRQNLAFIPQMTNSFHPAIPLAKQLQNAYESSKGRIRQKADVDRFRTLVERLGKRAGFSDITLLPDLSKLKLSDKKEYEDTKGASVTIIDVEKVVTFERELSTGQLQRLLVLRALIQFESALVLFGDEFLVNFSFTEGNKVLKGILETLNEQIAASGSTHPRIAAFIFHDLSYKVLVELERTIPQLQAKIMLLEETKESKEYPDEKKGRTIGVQTISAKDFWSDTLPKDSPYYRFRESYRPVEESQTCSCVQNISSQELIFKKDEYGPYAYPETTQKVYEKFTFPFKENHFMILTGFSGCGKSTFCNQLVEKEISRKDKYKFRYFPARSQESLASGSQICVEEDLQSIYQFYNEISNIHDPKTANKIIEHFRAVQLFKKENDMSYYEAFLKKPLYSLSGGELQRYWFARITFMYGIPEDQKPKLLIFDESISSLDCMTKDTLLHFIVTELFEKEHLSILFVTHDLRDIGVLHNILAQQKKAELFQHFELFDKRMFQVRTPYFTYKDNAVSGAFNEYEETSTGERYTYRIKGGG